jgi:hypothetical protein
MSQFASQHKKHPCSASPRSDKENRSRGIARRRVNRDGARNALSSQNGITSAQEIPFGAIRVDASGIVLEHRLPEADFIAQARSIVGKPIQSISAWAREPRFLSALQAAIDSTRVSFHLDFKTSTKPVERLIHVNILAVGDKTVWIFISDKTLP